MKLYTEEQVKEMLSMTDNIDIDGDLFTHNDIISSQIPIELPSDEDIYDKAVFHDGSDYSLGEHNGFINGAKWIKEQILNQNK